MKELGEYLKEQRESNGVGIEEASEDLDILKDDLENIEAGNIRAFKDVLSLKSKIKVYAKYLGLDPEKVADEFNDFMFEHTSKISLADILEAEKKTNEEVQAQKQIRSPYTKIRKKKVNHKGIAIFIGAFLIVIVLILILMKLLEPKDPIINQELESGGEKYELTY